MAHIPVLFNLRGTSGCNKSITQLLASEIGCSWYSDHKLSQGGNSYMQSVAPVWVNILSLWRKLVLVSKMGKMERKRKWAQKKYQDRKPGRNSGQLGPICYTKASKTGVGWGGVGGGVAFIPEVNMVAYWGWERRFRIPISLKKIPLNYLFIIIF